MQKFITCQLCGTSVLRTGRSQKYCPSCKVVKGRERSYLHRVKTGSIKQPGVGSGNAQGRGENSPYWKTGIGQYREALKDSCERCGSTGKRCVHHKDRNRGNNSPENLETLCRKCHAKEHWKDRRAAGKIPNPKRGRDGRFIK